MFAGCSSLMCGNIRITGIPVIILNTVNNRNYFYTNFPLFPINVKQNSHIRNEVFRNTSTTLSTSTSNTLSTSTSIALSTSASIALRTSASGSSVQALGMLVLMMSLYFTKFIKT
ncbi:hypothetical protein KORDIASMS9_03257 [Kordia sp. SMS9]|nr:hypothetical protein KORDIASMS9_03257 [Kordia sp. SMS9]